MKEKTDSSEDMNNLLNYFMQTTMLYDLEIMVI